MGGKCVATADADYKASYSCKSWGLCTLKDGRCRRLPDADCMRTKHCKWRGECTLIEGKGCAWGASSDADCDTKRGNGKVDPCRIYGLCTARDGYCVAASNLDCLRSWACEAKGQCSAQNGWCAPGSDADCRRTKECKFPAQVDGPSSPAHYRATATSGRTPWCATVKRKAAVLIGPAVSTEWRSCWWPRR